jgi:hypothetical protein
VISQVVEGVLKFYAEPLKKGFLSHINTSTATPKQIFTITDLCCRVSVCEYYIHVEMCTLAKAES